MNAQEILENLAKLESNLQNIDSARKQVETLSSSYEATEKQLQNVASQITSIVNDLNIIFKTIKSNNDLTSREIDNKIGTVINNLNGKISGVQTEIDGIKQRFSNDCDTIKVNLETSANQTIEKINTGITAILTSLNEKAKKEIENISSTVKSFKDATYSALTDHKTSMQDISSKFYDDIQSHVSSFNETKQGLDSVLETSKEQSETLLKKISDEVTKVNAVVKEYDTKLNRKIDEKFGSSISKLDSITNSLNQTDKKVETSFAKVNTDIASNHKLLMILVAISIISLLLNLAKFLI